VPRFFLFVAILALTAPAALAHNVILSAWPAGDVIQGEVGLSSGEFAEPGTVVRVLGADGEELGMTTVGEDGLFRFEPSAAVAHRFVADLGQGHVAAITLGVDQLPASVTAAATASGTAHAASPPVAAATPRAARAAGAAIDATRLETLVASAVQRELAPLKRQLAAREQEADLQALIGGIGYICGIFGLLFFIYARRRTNA
jgi:nickel transport protein